MPQTPKISETRKNKIEKMCASWATLARGLKTLSYDECFHVIERELTTRRERPRPEFIVRPFTRAVRLYRTKLWASIQKTCPGAGKR